MYMGLLKTLCYSLFDDHTSAVLANICKIGYNLVYKISLFILLSTAFLNSFAHSFYQKILGAFFVCMKFLSLLDAFSSHQTTAGNFTRHVLNLHVILRIDFCIQSFIQEHVSPFCRILFYIF